MTCEQVSPILLFARSPFPLQSQQIFVRFAALLHVDTPRRNVRHDSDCRMEPKGLMFINSLLETRFGRLTENRQHVRELINSVKRELTVQPGEPVEC